MTHFLQRKATWRARFMFYLPQGRPTGGRSLLTSAVIDYCHFTLRLFALHQMMKHGFSFHTSILVLLLGNLSFRKMTFRLKIQIKCFSWNNVGEEIMESSVVKDGECICLNTFTIQIYTESRRQEKARKAKKKVK